MKKQEQKHGGKKQKQKQKTLSLILFPSPSVTEPATAPTATFKKKTVSFGIAGGATKNERDARKWGITMTCNTQYWPNIRRP